jgi:hypothetical protein
MGVRRGTATVGVLALLTLTGCSPSVSGILGLQRVGDDFRVLVATCDDFDPPNARLLDRSRVGSNNEYLTVGEWPVDAVVDGVPYHPLDGDDLHDLLGDGEFMLSGKSGGFVPSVVYGPTFTLTDVNELLDGEILTVDTGTFEEIVVSDIAKMSSPPDLPACG